jgi:hypothetical protein
MNTYRVGGSWKTHTIILEGSEPADERGRRPDDLPVAWVGSAAPEGLATRICELLNGAELVGLLLVEANLLRAGYGRPGNDYSIEYVNGFEDALGAAENWIADSAGR